MRMIASSIIVVAGAILWTGGIVARNIAELFGVILVLFGLVAFVRAWIQDRKDNSR